VNPWGYGVAAFLRAEWGYWSVQNRKSRQRVAAPQYAPNEIAHLREVQAFNPRQFLSLTIEIVECV